MNIAIGCQNALFIAFKNAVFNITIIRMAAKCKHTALFVQQIINLIYAQAVFLHDIKRNVRVNITGARAHNGSGERGKAH